MAAAAATAAAAEALQNGCAERRHEDAQNGGAGADDSPGARDNQ